MFLAPVTIFVYNRPWHIKQTIEALKKNKLARESELFIFSDGPKDEKDKKKVEEVRNYIRSLDGFKDITIRERRKNYGLAESIIAGVTEIVNIYERIIVLEDDLLTSPYFLQFMNNALNRYQGVENVASVHGYVYPIKKVLPETFFLKDPGCLGWATWKRAWRLFDKNSETLLRQLLYRKLTDEFDYSHSYPFTEMLQKQANGQVNSWAIRWYASLFLKNKLILYPGRSLVYHNGNDGSGTNFRNSKELDVELSQRPIKVVKIPLKENQNVFKAIKEYFIENYPRRWGTSSLCEKLFHLVKSGVNLLISLYRPYGWFGNYRSWEEAASESAGYESDIILKKVKNALLKVKNGEAIYERDSVLFNHIEYSWPLLAGLMWIASKGKNMLNIIDFGGSLGSTYYQNRNFLKELDELRWNIVEQRKFVEYGKKYFEDNQLKFYSDIEECIRENNSNAILFSGVIQYLEKPYRFIEKILNFNFEYIIIDRTGVLNIGEDRLTVQKVSPRIYNASYPCWFFNEKKFLGRFMKNYTLITDFSAEKGSVINLGNATAGWKGYIFKLNKQKL